MSSEIIVSGRKRQHSSSTSGFMLIELIMVMVIIVLLLGLVVGGAQLAIDRARRTRASADIQNIHAALACYSEEYNVSFLTASPANTYPYPTIAGNDASTLLSTAVAEFLGAGISCVDPWGMNYVYEYDSTSSPEVYYLWSHGGDPGNPAMKIEEAGGTVSGHSTEYVASDPELAEATL